MAFFFSFLSSKTTNERKKKHPRIKHKQGTILGGEETKKGVLVYVLLLKRLEGI